MRVFVLVFAFVFLSSISVGAQQAGSLHKIDADLARSSIDVRAGFSGDHVVVYGVRYGRGDVVIVLRGMEHDAVVRQKSRILGAWINKKSYRFESMPYFYDYTASAPLPDLAREEVLKRYEIGMENLDFGELDDDKAIFKSAFIRTRQGAGLYAREPAKIRFMADDFFKASFYVPANVHVGSYLVQVLYLEGGQVVDDLNLSLQVEHKGMNAQVLDFAQGSSFFYGLLCVALALIAGWVSNRLRH